MDSGVARLLALFLVLEGILITCYARHGSFGSKQTSADKLSQDQIAKKSALAGCDFDDPESPFCDWTQPQDGGANWLREKGGKPGESPGPPGGTPERRGYYIYPEKGESVQFQSPGLDPPGSEICVEFLYYLYSLSPKAQLAVQILDSSGNVSTLWTQGGMQSSAWLLGSVTAQNPVQHPFKVIFTATQVNTQVITMALDTISIRLGPCSPCTTGCDFDVDGDLCGWENPAAGDVQWEPWVGTGPEYGVGPEDDFSKPGFGYYMLLDSLDSDSGGAALLKSPPYQSPGGCLSLSFYYTLHGVSSETALNVYAALVSEGEVGTPLLTLRGDRGPDWNPGAVNYTGTETIQFVLEGIYRGKPGLAVDSVRISTCEEIFAQCDFNDNSDPFCGWINSGDNNNTWTRANQTTPTEDTGPPGDYPHGEGYYIYTEGGSLEPGQSMLLSSRAFCTDTEACVEFYYHMHAIVPVDTQLRVLLEGPSGIMTLLWTRMGNQSPEWLLGSVTVPYDGPQPSRVVFEVIRGNNPYMDVSLDNISIRRGPCAATGTPMPPATSITATSGQAWPSVSVPPAPPATCLPTPAGPTTPAAATGATPQLSTIGKPQPTTFNTTASRTTTTTQGEVSSATTKPMAPYTSSPSPATLPQSSHTMTIASPTSTTPKTTGTSPASSSQGSQTTARHPSSTQTTGHSSKATSVSTTSFSSETSPARTTSSHSKTTSGSSTSVAPSPAHTSPTSGSLPSGTLGPTSHASSPSYTTSHPQTAATIHATTQSHVSTHQTSATTGGPSTSHTEAMKPTPSSTATAASSTTTTSSFQPSTQSATTSHSDVATSQATLPTTASSQASTTHRSPTSAVQTTRGTTPSNSSHQTSVTTGGPSTSHTEAMKPTPSSTATAASSTTTTTSSFQPSTQSATTGHSDAVTSHATLPTTASSQASTTQRSPTSAVQTTSSQTTRGTTPSSSSHQTSATTGGPSTSHTEAMKPTPSSTATAASSTTTTTSGSFQPSTQSATTGHSDAVTSHATLPTTASSQASTTHRSPTSAVQATTSQTTRGTTPSSSSHTTSTVAAGHTTLTTTMTGSLGPNATSSASSTSQTGHSTSATPSLGNSSATRGTTGARPNTEPGSKPPSPSATPSGPSHLATASSSTVQANPTTWSSTPKATSGQNATTTTPGHSQPSRPSTTTSTGHPPTVGHISSMTTSQVPPTATRPSPTTTSSIHPSPTTSGLTSRTSSHVSAATPTVSHASTANGTPHVVPNTTLGAVEPTARTSSQTTITSTKSGSPGTTAGPMVTTSILATQTTTAKATSTAEDSTRTTTKPSAVPPGQDICTVSGDPHYTTYDGRLFHFMGTCTYLLSAVCNATPGLPTFQVQATNEHRGGNTQVSYVKSVQVEVYGVRIVLLKGRRVTVDGQRVTLPVSVAEGKVSVRLSGTFVLVQTDFGLWVRFNGNHHVEIAVPPSYMGWLCGLCGNYNGQTADDNLMPDGSSAGTDADRLGESWQVENAEEDSASCSNTGDPGKCDQDMEAEARKPTNCGILTDPEGPFAPCHSEVPPEGPLENCVYDLCATGGEVSLLCSALQSYADRCAQAGIPVAWRNSSFCPLNCPLGSTYTPCGPACPATCTDPDSPNSCPEMPCVEGCVCDKGTVLSGDQCVALAQCGCTDSAGRYHAVGDHWMGNENCTQRCTCGPLNNVTCEEWACSVIQECRPLEGLLGCQDTGVAACHVAGDPHYFTFDGTMVSFMGTCTYTLVNVCLSNPRLPSFNIVGKNEERGQPEESYLRQVTVEVAGYSVTLQKSRRVLIDGVRVRTPVEGRIPGVSITISGIYVVLETDFGLAVKFDGNHHLEIQLPGTYFSKVCGMCGNFNNNSQDDLLMPNGHLAANDSQFGNSWKAPGDPDQGCQPDHREDLEPHCTSTERGPLHALCSEILQPKYQACHNVIDPQLFIQSCLYDMCEYQGMASVLCDNIQSYVEACKSQGVPAISWRNSTFCPLPCPSHSHYTECAPPCPATCSNLYAPASCQRPTTCVEGCICDSGYVLSDDSCVSMRDCGCLDAQHNYYGPGDTWMTANCHQRCTCEGNGIINCQEFQCQLGSSCTLSSAGLRYCQPIKFHQCVISGDPHYRTFDFFAHHFQGRSTYVLTQTLRNLPGSLVPFSVAGRNFRRFPFHRFSFLREVYISIYGYQITLMQGRKLAVNGLMICPPFYSRDTRLQITQRGRGLIVQTDFGFSVSFDGRDFAEIVLPSTYQEHVGGLCGNYDGQRNNEYMMPDGTWTRSLSAFGNSWKVSSQRATLGRNHIRTRREEEPTDEAESGFEVDCSTEQLMLINGTDICGALSDPQGPFAACHSVVSPDTFQESCVYDLCALFNDTELLCQDYEAYVNLCQEEGVTLTSWRQETGCDLSCPAHTTYQSCMTACPASCANLAAPSDCQAPCVEGCASDPGYILSGLESVPYNQCGCTSNDQYYEINDTFLTDDCSQRCTCHSTGTLECEMAGCLEGQVCTVANYTRGCFKESPCLRRPCQNEGACFEEESLEGFSCSCLEGYTGPFCEETLVDASPTSHPTSHPLPDKADNNLVAILTGVLVPLAIILIAVMITCFCCRRNRKKKEEDCLAVLPAEVQSKTSAPDQNKVTPF